MGRHTQGSKSHSRRIDSVCDCAGREVEQISSTARNVVDNISELVWATKPKNDTLDNLVAYLREYSARYFEGTSIRCRLCFPENVAGVPVSAELRRGLFLVVKEALHNVVKHSGATRAEVKLELKRSTLNGHRSTFNEKTEMDNAAATELNTIEIEPHCGEGTRVKLLVKL